MQWVVGFMILGVIAVLGQLYYIQVIRFSELQLEAIRQQTRETPIRPDRGMIFDRNMRVLASSAAVERVFISPQTLGIRPGADGEFEDDEATPAMRAEKAARLISEYFSEYFGLDYDWVFERTQRKHRRDETILPRAEISDANRVRQFAADNRIIGIHFAKESKRIYPYSNLASHVIGFTGADNTGLLGIEAKFDEHLRGVPGRIITARDARNNLMRSEYETYIGARNGNNLVLTIDWAIQNFLERHLETAFAETRPSQRVAGVIMDVHTGEILAMATKPDFDLNDPFRIDEDTMEFINLQWAQVNQIEREIARLEAERGEALSENERNRLFERARLNKLWSNKVITEPYEPGSTFKVITAAIALDVGVSSPDDIFFCSGSLQIGGHSIGCHVRHGHGRLTWAEGLKVSCNPVTMLTAEKIGADTFLKYFNAFGFNERTGIDLPGEAVGLTHSRMGTVELATSSFGQTFTITPIQNIVALAAVANGGRIVTPRVVRAIVDDEGNLIKSFEPEIKRTVLSGETARTIAGILAEGVAGGGSGRNAAVKGYSVAAKTGTSQKRGLHDDENARIGSASAFAPADNPQVAVLIIIDEPDLRISSMYGGVIAAPRIAEVLADTLPYLGIEPQFTEEEIAELRVLVRDYRMQTVSAAKEDIVSRGFEYVVVGGGEFIMAQIPRQGSSLRRGGRIILYTEESIPERNSDNLVEVPNVLNTTAETANRRITDAGLNINIEGVTRIGSGAEAYSQEPAAGAQVPRGTIVTVNFRHGGSG